MLRLVSKSAILFGIFAIAAVGCDTGSRGGGVTRDIDLTVPMFNANFVGLPTLEMPTTSPAEGSQATFPMVTVANGGTDAAQTFEVALVSDTGAPTIGSRVYDRGRVAGLAAGQTLTLTPPPALSTIDRVMSPGALPVPMGAMAFPRYKDPNDNYQLGTVANELGIRAIDASNGTPGMFNMGCVADSSSGIIETDETNNIGVDMQTYTFAANTMTPDLTPSSFLTFDFNNMPPSFGTNFDINLSVTNVGAVTSTATNIFCIVYDNMGNSTQPITGPNNLGTLMSITAGSTMNVSLACNVQQNVMNPANFSNGSILQFYVWLDVDPTAPGMNPPGNAFSPGNVNENNEYNNGQSEFLLFQ